jgi:hypothetical protein
MEDCKPVFWVQHFITDGHAYVKMKSWKSIFRIGCLGLSLMAVSGMVVNISRHSLLCLPLELYEIIVFK